MINRKSRAILLKILITIDVDISQSLENKYSFASKNKRIFLDDALYENIDDLKKELLVFLVYYKNQKA